MIPKVQERNQARQLRKSGKSIRFIAKKLGVSTSSASLWCKDIELSRAQIELLQKKGANRELLQRFARNRHQEKIRKTEQLFNQSKLEISSLNKDELFKVGLALYWAEGFKNIKEGRVGFCNSDPRMVRFIMLWFRKSIGIKDDDFTLRVEFNIQHSVRKDEIEKYWAKQTNIPLSQFNKPYLQKTNKIRVYQKEEPYYGMLRIRIRKSSDLLIKLRGWIEGLSSII